MQLRYRVSRYALLAALAIARTAHAQTQTTNEAASQAPNPTPGSETTAGQPPSDTTATGEAAPTRKSAQEEIVVTGSRVRRKDLSTPAPVTVISRQQIQNSPVANIGDFLQMMPEQGNATNTQVNNGGNGTTQVSLRSLGAVRTLVLVDGKRFVYGGGGADNTVDLNSIPTAAIERVEVLKDGASAVYGSDAIAGVVNIITRRRINGTELAAYAGTSQHGDGTVYDINVSTGANSDKGAFLFAAGYYDQRSFLADNRDWARFALSYDYTTPGVESPGGSSRIPQGRVQIDPSTCTTATCTALAAKFGSGRKTFMFDPSSPDSAAGFRLFTANDFYNYQAVNYLITPSQRISLFTNGDYHLADSARAYFQGSFVNRQSSYLIAPEPLDIAGLGIAMSGQNAYNPFGINIVPIRKRLVSAVGRSAASDIDTYRVVVGVDGTMPEEFGPAKGWFYDLAFNYGRSTGTTITNGSVNALNVAAAIGPSFTDSGGVLRCGTPANPVPGCVPANLFGVNNPTPDQLTSLGLERLVNRGWNQQTQVQANFNGELFQLGSDRPVGLAFGYEFRREYGGFTPDQIASLTFTNSFGITSFVDSDYGSFPTSGSFNVNEGYAELDVPLLSRAPLVDDLEIQAAVRVFHYSTFGTDSTYKFGARYRPIRDVTLRATYSTAFRAPSVPELYSGRGPSAESASDPCGNTAGNATLQAQCRNAPGTAGGANAVDNGDDNVQINSNAGGNAALQPEKAKTFTVGVVLEPQMVRGLTLTVDYYNIQITNTIVGGGNASQLTSQYLGSCYPGDRGTQNADACSHIHRDPATGQISAVDDYFRNFGDLRTYGIDFAGRYSLPTDFGRFGFLVDANVLLKLDQGLYSTVKGAGNYDLGVNPTLKMNIGLNYGIGGFNAGILAHYIGQFTECAAADGSNVNAFCSDHNIDPATGQEFKPHTIASETTFDVMAGYALRNPLGMTNFTVGIRNAFNTNPTRIYNSFLTYADPTAYDFVGRYFFGRISHTF